MPLEIKSRWKLKGRYIRTRISTVPLEIKSYTDTYISAHGYAYHRAGPCHDPTGTLQEFTTTTSVATVAILCPATCHDPTVTATYPPRLHTLQSLCASQMLLCMVHNFPLTLFTFPPKVTFHLFFSILVAVTTLSHARQYPEGLGDMHEVP